MSKERLGQRKPNRIPDRLLTGEDFSNYKTPEYKAIEKALRELRKMY